jgi:hypothetical protein
VTHRLVEVEYPQDNVSGPQNASQCHQNSPEYCAAIRPFGLLVVVGRMFHDAFAHAAHDLDLKVEPGNHTTGQHETGLLFFA